MVKPSHFALQNLIFLKHFKVKAFRPKPIFFVYNPRILLWPKSNKLPKFVTEFQCKRTEHTKKTPLNDNE